VRAGHARALVVAWLAFALFVTWLTYQPWPIAFYHVDPYARSYYDEYDPSTRDTWLGGPTP
jgi:hypothetical protein